MIVAPTVGLLLAVQSLSMVTTRRPAATKSCRAAVMGYTSSDDLFGPGNEEEAVEQAVKLVLRAASHLVLAADLAEEAEVVSQYINSAIHLRDLANSLSPDRPDWPPNVVPFVPRKA